MIGKGCSYTKPAAILVSGLMLGLWAGPAAAQVVADDVQCSGCVDQEDLADLSITDRKLADDSIGDRKLKDNTVGQKKLKDGTITTKKIVDGAVTEEKLSFDPVTEDELVQGTEVDVDCDGGDSLAAEVEDAPPNTTLYVSGTCNENIVIDRSKTGLTLDGQGLTVVTAASGPVIRVNGRGIIITNFAIDGGTNGILVNVDASAEINTNVIRNAGARGILVQQGSYATIINNVVRNNGGNGIAIREGSSVRIGTTCSDKNTIRDNGQSGIAVSNNSDAFILGNDIINNGSSGIFVTDNSMADTGSNNISGNNGDGVDVRRSSSVRMGRQNEASSCATDPNSTNSSNKNDFWGIQCESQSTVQGLLGTLLGRSGDADLKDSNADCPNCCFADLL